ncbi:MAG: YHYH protein [Isosphaeraceae bacterium]
MAISRRGWMGLAALGSAGAGVGAAAWLRGRAAARGPSVVAETIEGDRRLVVANGLPDHPSGDFPNPHDPVRLRVQDHHFAMPLHPTPASSIEPLAMWLFGVAINGVPFDPSGPFWNRDGRSGWQFEVMSPAAAVALGIDVNHAHTQGGGIYHYHGIPTGLIWNLVARSGADRAPLLRIGRAADGFPIYGPDGPSDPSDLKSPIRRLRSSYRLRGGRRNSGPGGRFDGTFVEDYEYIPGHGDLDECNGRFGPTPDEPGGTYYYIVTDDFPHIPRFFRGTPDPSFRHGPPPGVSPPVPPELLRYRGLT